MDPSPSPVLAAETEWPLKPVTISLDGVPLAMAVNMVAAEAGCVCVAPTDAKVEVFFSGVRQPARRVFEVIAGQAGLVASFRDGTVTLSKPGTGPGSLFLLHPGFEDPVEVSEVMSSVIEGARVRKLGGRVAVWARDDQMADLRKVVDALDVGPDGWLLDVRVAAVSGSLRDELGLGVSASFDGSLSVAGAAGGLDGPLSGVKAALAVRAIGSAVSEGREARILTEGTLALVEGSEASLQQGETIPIPKRTVSPEGTVTVTGYQDVRTGFILKATGRRVPGGMRLSLAPTLSSVSGYVEGAPVVSERTVTGALIVQSGEWVILSGLTISQAARSAAGGGVFGGVVTDTAGREAVIVLVRATRVHASVAVRPLGGGGLGGTGGGGPTPPSQSPAVRPSDVDNPSATPDTPLPGPDQRQVR